MKGFALLSTFLLLIPFSIASLEEICRNATQIQGDYKFCITTLGAVPGSRTADTRGVAIIAAQLVKARYASIMDKAKKLLNDKGLSPSMTQPLGECLNAYLPASQRVQTAVNELGSFKFRDALADLRAAASAPVACALAFYRIGPNWPLNNENHYNMDLGNLAWEIVDLLSK